MDIEITKLNRNAQLIYNHVEAKYKLGVIGIIKAIAVSSITLKSIEPLNFLIIAPSRQYKSQTSTEIKKALETKNYIDIGSDFTINSMLTLDEGKNHKFFNNKTLFVNDLTLLLASKNKQAKDRLINGLAEVLSDGVYVYSERQFADLELKARMNLIGNVTLESFIHNQKTFFENTFGERFIRIFYKLTKEQQLELAKTRDERKKIDWKKTNTGSYDKIKLDTQIKTVSMSKEIKDIIIEKTKGWTIFTQTTNIDDLYNKMVSIVKSYVKLNNDSVVKKEDLYILDVILPYLKMEDMRKYDIQIMYLQGKTQTEIIEHFNYTSDSVKSWVSRCIKELVHRGVV